MIGDKRLDVAEGQEKSAGEQHTHKIILVPPAFTHILNHKLAVQKGSEDSCGPE